jgi:hypothetical protein
MGTDGLSTQSQLRAERKRRTAKPREAQNRRARADKHNARAPTGACAVTERPRGHTHTHTHTKPQTTPTVGGLLGRCSSSRHAWSAVGDSRHLKSGRHRQAAVPMESLPLTRLHPCRRRSDANVSQWPAPGGSREGLIEGGRVRMIVKQNGTRESLGLYRRRLGLHRRRLRKRPRRRRSRSCLESCGRGRG